MPFERRRDNESLDVAGISSWHSKHSSGVWHGRVLFDRRPSRTQISFIISRNRSYGFSPHVRRRADADLGRLGDLVYFLLAVLSSSEHEFFVRCFEEEGIFLSNKPITARLTQIGVAGHFDNCWPVRSDR